MLIGTKTLQMIKNCVTRTFYPASSTASTYRKANVDTPLGTKAGYAVYLTALPCRVRSVSASEMPEDIRVDALRTFCFTFWNGLDMRSSDRILYQGTYYNITGIQNPTTGTQMTTQVMAVAESADFVNQVLQG